METAFIQSLEEIALQEGVKGVLVSDAEGLCMGARGSLRPFSAGTMTSIASKALKIAMINAGVPVTATSADAVNTVVTAASAAAAVGDNLNGGLNSGGSYGGGSSCNSSINNNVVNLVGGGDGGIVTVLIESDKGDILIQQDDLTVSILLA